MSHFRYLIMIRYLLTKTIIYTLYCSMLTNAYITTDQALLTNSTLRYKLEHISPKLLKKGSNTSDVVKNKSFTGNTSNTNYINHITNQFWIQERFNNLIKNGTLNRGMYILIGATTIVLLYFLIKAIMVRKRKSKVKKYGILNGDFEYDQEDWGDSWSRKGKEATRAVFAKSKSGKNGLASSGKAHKWEMTPLDHFDPDDMASDDDGSDIDLYRAPTPTKNSKKPSLPRSANQLYYKSTLSTDQPAS